MNWIYIIPVAIGYGIDMIDLAKWLKAYFGRKTLPSPSFDTISIYFLIAWGISGLMYFGKPPQEIIKVWNKFLITLFIAFCMHLFICFILPFLITVICNLHYGRKLLDKSPLPPLKPWTGV